MLVNSILRSNDHILNWQHFLRSGFLNLLSKTNKSFFPAPIIIKEWCRLQSCFGLQACVGTQSCHTLCDLCPWNFPGKHIEVCCHFLLQGPSQLRDWARSSRDSCIGRWVFITALSGKPLCWVTRSLIWFLKEKLIPKVDCFSSNLTLGEIHDFISLTFS